MAPRHTFQPLSPPALSCLVLSFTHMPKKIVCFEGVECRAPRHGVQRRHSTPPFRVAFFRAWLLLRTRAMHTSRHVTAKNRQASSGLALRTPPPSVAASMPPLCCGTPVRVVETPRSGDTGIHPPPVYPASCAAAGRVWPPRA